MDRFDNGFDSESIEARAARNASTRYRREQENKVSGVPVVNLNGTSREDLVEQNAAVGRAINEAIKLAEQATPHGRDFQINKDPHGDYALARDAHLDRVRRLEALSQEFYELAAAIMNQ